MYLLAADIMCIKQTMTISNVVNFNILLVTVFEMLCVLLARVLK